MSHTPSKDREGHPNDRPHTPNKDRDGHHVKDLGRDILNLFKRKKKKSDQSFSPHPISPIPSSDNQREDHSDPVSVPIHHLPRTPPAHSEVTQHSADTRSARLTAHSATSLTEITSTGATSGESVDHDNSIDDHQKKMTTEERRAHFRSLGVHVVADEDDHTQFEESHCPFRVDRRLIDRLQWKDGIAPVDFGKPKKPRFVKKKENKDEEKLKPRSEMEIMKDAIPLEEAKKKEMEVKVEDGLSTKEKRLKEAIPIEDKTPRKKSREEKKKKTEELKDAIPLEEKKEQKDGELKDAIPLEEKKEKKKKEKEKEKEEEIPVISQRRRKNRKRSEEEQAIEDSSDKEKRKKRRDKGIEDNSDQEKRRKKRDKGTDGIHLEERSEGRKKKSRDGEKKREEKGKDDKKDEKKEEKRKEGGEEGKKKEAKGGEEKDGKKERGKEKERKGDEKKSDEETMNGERELREARRKDEVKIGEKEKEDSNDKLSVVPYEEWPVPALVEKVDQFIGYRVLTGGYKAFYFGYVCMHVSYSFFAHLANFDFNRSVPSSISKKLTPSTPSKQSKSGKKDEGATPISWTARSTPRSRHSSTKRIVIKKPVEYSNPSVPSSDSVDVAMCH